MSNTRDADFQKLREMIKDIDFCRADHAWTKIAISAPAHVSKPRSRIRKETFGSSLRLSRTKCLN